MNSGASSDSYPHLESLRPDALFYAGEYERLKKLTTEANQTGLFQSGFHEAVDHLLSNIGPFTDTRAYGSVELTEYLTGFRGPAEFIFYIDGFGPPQG